MMYHFSKNQKGGVSPIFAIFMCAIFAVIGAGLYFEDNTAYLIFDSLFNDMRIFSNL